jgi:hypothetical protein
MNTSTFPKDGYAGFGQDGKAVIVGKVSKGAQVVYTDAVTPFFAETEADLIALISKSPFKLPK